MSCALYAFTPFSTSAATGDGASAERTDAERTGTEKTNTAASGTWRMRASSGAFRGSL